MPSIFPEKLVAMETLEEDKKAEVCKLIHN
jgi:hypothetical protein